MKRRIGSVLVILLSAVVLGIILLTLILALPVDTARENVEQSLYNMIEVVEDENGSAWRKKIIGAKDNFTDCLMVQNALEKIEGQSPLAHAIYVYHYDLANEQTWLTEESLPAMLRNGYEGMYLREYSRYWHGYLIWLKPLLMCMSWSSAETFLIIFQIALLLSVVILSFRQKQGLTGLGILVAFMFMKPLQVWASLTMMACWNIVLIALLADMLLQRAIVKKNRQEQFFLLIGIMTSYMDFLTYPIVTLGVPLCFYIVQNMEDENGWWQKLKQLFWMAFSWSVGYIGMWGMKWVVAEVLFQTGTLKDAIWSVIFRSEPLDGYGSIFSGVSRTVSAVLQQYDSVWYSIGFSVVFVLALGTVCWCLIKAANPQWMVSVIALAVISLFPFVWIIFIQNHTAIHCSFTFRIMSVTVMALWCMTVCSVRTIRNRKSLENIEK